MSPRLRKEQVEQMGGEHKTIHYVMNVKRAVNHTSWCIVKVKNLQD